jgi:ATP-dependent protease ClpP protease subunit
MKKLLAVLFAALLAVTLTSGSSQAAEPATVMYLHGMITEKSVLPLVANFTKLVQLPKEKRPALVVIEINSYGGDYDASFLLAKTIEMSPIEVLCQVDGTAASGAFFILQSCDHRTATGRSSLMWHNATMGDIDITANNVAAIAKRIEVLNAGMTHHVAKKLKISKQEVAAKIALSDWWMTPDEALTVGAIEAVVP